MQTTSRCLLAVLAAAGVLYAGCGGDDPGQQPTASGEDGAPDNAQAITYSRCMRENGVPGFPDPQNGRLMLRGGKDGIDPESPSFQAAEKACRKLAPTGPKGGSPDSKEMQERALAHAKCMRANGVPTFPDPEFTGGGARIRLPRGVDRSALQAAEKTCGDLMRNPESSR
jgi:hypothetical protein